MKVPFLAICLFINFNACRTNKNPGQEIKFYHRVKLGSSDYGTASYSDYLTISYYENKPATAQQLIDLANLYLDTAHAKFPIEEITFIAKNVETPKLYWDSEILGRDRKYFLVTFDYTHTVFDSVNRKKQLNSITVWKNTEPSIYHQNYFYSNGKRGEGKNLIDSILKSTQPLFNAGKTLITSQ
jgi:hypothetical protein